MDVFLEKPLNRAHLYERKAKQFRSQGNYEAAVSYFEKASNCITEAMRSTCPVNCLPILQLQYDFYLTQMQVKERKIDHELVEMERLEEVDAFSRQHTSDSFKTNDSNDEENKSKNQQNIKNESTRMSRIFTPDREPDSLLQFLNPVEKFETHCRKCPKDEKDVIEELKTQIKNFENMVKDLLEKNERLEKINKSLINKNDDLKLEVKELQAQLMNSDKSKAGIMAESFSSSLFPLDHHVEPGFAQPQSFFHFDDPLTVYQLNKAMEEDCEALIETSGADDSVASNSCGDSPSSSTLILQEQKGVSNPAVLNNGPSSTNAISIRYEELDDS